MRQDEAILADVLNALLGNLGSENGCIVKLYERPEIFERLVLVCMSPYRYCTSSEIKDCIILGLILGMVVKLT